MGLGCGELISVAIWRGVVSSKANGVCYGSLACCVVQLKEQAGSISPWKSQGLRDHPQANTLSAGVQLPACEVRLY